MKKSEFLKNLYGALKIAVSVLLVSAAIFAAVRLSDYIVARQLERAITEAHENFLAGMPDANRIWDDDQIQQAGRIPSDAERPMV